jgi:hypothetical protein
MGSIRYLLPLLQKFLSVGFERIRSKWKLFRSFEASVVILIAFPEAPTSQSEMCHEIWHIRKLPSGSLAKISGSWKWQYFPFRIPVLLSQLCLAIESDEFTSVSMAFSFV